MDNRLMQLIESLEGRLTMLTGPEAEAAAAAGAAGGAAAGATARRQQGTAAPAAAQVRSAHLVHTRMARFGQAKAMDRTQPLQQ